MNPPNLQDVARKRVTDAHVARLNELIDRLGDHPLTDEGLQTWLRHQVQFLDQEIGGGTVLAMDMTAGFYSPDHLTLFLTDGRQWVNYIGRGLSRPVTDGELIEVDSTDMSLAVMRLDIESLAAAQPLTETELPAVAWLNEDGDIRTLAALVEHLYTQRDTDPAVASLLYPDEILAEYASRRRAISEALDSPLHALVSLWHYFVELLRGKGGVTVYAAEYALDPEGDLRYRLLWHTGKRRFEMIVNYSLMARLQAEVLARQNEADAERHPIPQDVT